MENHDGDYYEPLWDQSGDFGGSEHFPDSMLQSGRTDICGKFSKFFGKTGQQLI